MKFKTKTKREEIMKKGKKVLQIERPTKGITVPKMYRRDVRMRKNYGLHLNNLGALPKSQMLFKIWGWGAVHQPKHKKLKGWQKENRRYRKAG